MQTPKLCACATGISTFVAMVALMLADGMFPLALVLLVVGAGLMAGVCIFAERQ
jgi:hypothetical protein